MRKVRRPASGEEVLLLAGPKLVAGFSRVWPKIRSYGDCQNDSGAEAYRGVKAAGTLGAFLATTIAFFLVEMGDKTQIATVALAARFRDIVAVTAGTTIGMMLANVPAVFFGDALARRIPLKLVRICAAVSFVLLGLAALLWR